MYASQTKRLCVREDSTDDTRAQHHSPSSSAEDTTELQSTSNLAAAVRLSPSSAARRNFKSSAPASGGGGGGGGCSSGSSSGPLGVSSGSCGSNIALDSCNSGVVISGAMTASAAGSILGESENDMLVKNPNGGSNNNNGGGNNISNNNNNQAITSIHPRECRDHSQLKPEERVQISSADTSARTLNSQAMMNGLESSQSGADSEQQLIDRLANETLKEARLELILSIRNLITACNKRKGSLVNNPNFAKIIKIIDEEGQQAGPEVKAQLALLLCSVAKGGEQNVRILNDSYVDDKIFNLILNSQDDALIEACLRCLRAIMSWPKVSRHYVLYDNLHDSSQQQNASNSGPKRMIDFARFSKSHSVQECVANIFDATCNRSKDQIILFNSGALPCIIQMLESKSFRVILAALNWLSTICLTNAKISLEATRTRCPGSDQYLLDKLVELMRKDECIELQLSSAKCFTRIYKALEPNHLENDPRLTMHVLPTLVRMVHTDKSARLRAEAASTIASLIEGNPKLQHIASICDKLIDSLANMLESDAFLLAEIRECSSRLLQDGYDTNSFCSRSAHCSGSQSSQLLDLSNLDTAKPSELEAPEEKYPESVREMERSAFQALAALASNQETIRKKIFESCAVMHHLVRGLSDPDPRTLKSVLICLLSLSRSVQELRTNFNDSALYSGLKNLLLTSSQDILNLVLMILCNISMVFSPGKQHFLDAATIGIVCNLIKGSDKALKLSGMWILMNMVYMLESADLKFQILRTLRIEQITHMLENENDEQLLLKTLGFIRNLLSNRNHIEQIMSCHGDHLMRSLARLLDRCTSQRVKEQAICVLTNIADGAGSKALIMNNRVILSHLIRTIYDEEAGDTRIAAICCVTNLAHNDQEGARSRQSEMRKCGILEKLKSLLASDDILLQSRARTAYNQFLLGDKHAG